MAQPSVEGGPMGVLPSESNDAVQGVAASQDTAAPMVRIKLDLRSHLRNEFGGVGQSAGVASGVGAASGGSRLGGGLLTQRTTGVCPVGWMQKKGGASCWAAG